MDNEPEDVTVEHTLPGMELPDYHGKTPVGMKTNIGGTGNRISRAHEIGSKVIVVIEAKVKGAGHEETDAGILYVEKLSTIDLFELPGAQGRRLLSAIRSASRAANEGAEPIPFDPGSEVRTDGSGVVITPGDALSIENDPIVSALTDESKTPVVIVYSDGARELWPDEFGPTDPRPVIGSKVLDENDVESHVVKILDGASGELLEEWTTEQEDARLLELERTAMAEEAAADGDAAREILDGVGRDLPGETDPDGANDDLTGDPEDTFPGYAGDAPDDELVVDGDEAPEISTGEIETEADTLAEVVTFPTPTGDDFLFVDRQIVDLKTDVAELEDRDRVLRLVKAEEQGRGRGLKPRKGVLELLTKRAEELFTAEGFAPPGLPDEPTGFAPPADADQWED